MSRLYYTLLAGIIFFSAQSLYSQKIVEKDLSSVFEQYGVKGCFVLFDETDDLYMRYNPLTCDSGYIPASTFKIPHALIALEEGIIMDTSQVIKWDGHQWPVPSWNQDQTLKTSIKYSCVWVYEGFAKQIPIDTYYRYVRDFNYGNKDLTGPPSRFWLAGSFRISANQQLEFLRNFWHNRLPVSQRSVNIIKNCIILQKADDYTWSGKTGGGMVSDTDYVMWLVGYVEKGSRVYYYAMNFRSGNYQKDAPARYAITSQILRELQIIK